MLHIICIIYSYFFKVQVKGEKLAITNRKNHAVTFGIKENNEVILVQSYNSNFSY